MTSWINPFYSGLLININNIISIGVQFRLPIYQTNRFKRKKEMEKRANDNDFRHSDYDLSPLD